MGFDFGNGYRPDGTGGETPLHPLRFQYVFEGGGADGSEAAFLRLLNRLAICGLDAAAPPLLAAR